MNNQEPTFQRCLHDRKNPYVMISREMAQDKSISPKAKGVLLYLFSLPSDWKIYHSQLREGLGVGEEYINSAMDELLKAGYAERSRERINGMYQPYKYKIREFKKFPPNRENQPGSSGPVNPALHSKYSPMETKETATTKQTNAAVFSEEFNDNQIKDFQKSCEEKDRLAGQLKIFKCLEKVDIPDHDKIEITNSYPEECVKNAIGWATSPSNPPVKCLAASIKFACKKGLSVKNLTPVKKPADKTPLNPYPYNKTYWREIYLLLRKKSFKPEVRETNEYLELPNEKVYFKDMSFLEQISCYLRKIGAETEIFQFIKTCQEDLNNQ